MLSQLAQGVGSWSGHVVENGNVGKFAKEDSSHRHGITVTPRNKPAYQENPKVDNDDHHLVLPKTYITRKGALVLFSGSKDLKLTAQQEATLKAQLISKLKHEKNADLTNKFKTIERFTKSVLTFGEEDYDKESKSISDKDDPIFLGFLHSLNGEPVQDTNVKPGGDINYYVREIKSRAASSRAGNRKEGWISADADSLLETFTRPASKTSNKHTSRPASVNSQRSYRVLSADKLTARLKSASFMGRPLSAFSHNTEELEEINNRPHTVSGSRKSLHDSSQSLYSFHSQSGTSNIQLLSRAPTAMYQTSEAQFRINEQNGDIDSLQEDVVSKSDSLHDLPINNTSFSNSMDRIMSHEGQTDELHDSGAHIEISHNSDMHRKISHVSILSAHSIGSHALDEGEGHPVCDDFVVRAMGDAAADALLDQNEDKNSVSLSLFEEENILIAEDSSSVQDVHETVDPDVHRKNTLDLDHSYSVFQEGQLEMFELGDLHTQKTGTPQDSDSVYETSQKNFVDGLAQPLQPQYQIDMENGELFPKDDTHLTVEQEMAAQVMSHRDSIRSATSDRTASNQNEQITNEGRQSVSEGDRKSQASRLSNRNELVLDLQSLNAEEPPKDENYEEKLSNRSVSRHSRPVSAHSPRSSISSVSHTEELADQHGSSGSRSDRRSRMSHHSGRSRRSSKGSVKSRSPSRTPSEKLDLKEQVSRPPTPPTGVETQVTQDSALSSETKPNETLAEIHVSAEARSDENVAVRTSTPLQESMGKVLSRPASGSTTEVPKERTPTPLTKDSPVPIPKSPSPSRQETSSIIVKEENQEIISTAKPVAKDDISVSKDVEPTFEQFSVETENAPNSADLLKSTVTLAEAKEKAIAKPKVKSVASSKPAALSKTKKKASSPTRTSAKKSKSDDKPKKDFVKAMDIESMPTPDKDAPASEKFLRFDPEPAVFRPPPDPIAIEAAKRKEEEAKQKETELKQIAAEQYKQKNKQKLSTHKKEQEAIKKLESEVTEIIDSKDSARLAEEGGGLSLEEMELEQQILKEKLEAAEEKMKGETKKKGKKPEKPKKSKKVKEEPKRDLAKEKEALREAREAEKQRRLEEAQAIEEQIKSKELTKKQAEEEALAKQKALEEEMAAIKYEEEQARLAEEEAREALAAGRKAAREEREIRRKQEAERKKMEVQRRREEERKMQERAKIKEREMLERIADAEQRRKMMEEEALRKEEEELKELERLEEARKMAEEEEKRAKIEAEEREEMEREMERQIEEEAMARLIQEREEAEERRHRLEEQKRRIQEEEERKKQKVFEEQMKLREALRLQAEEEQRRQDEERERLYQLQKMEEEARKKMREEMDKRREILLRRRDVNLERKNHLSGIKRNQGMTKPWVFSYYVHWPRETYQRPMGEDPKEKKRGFRPKKPKPAPKS